MLQNPAAPSPVFESDVLDEHVSALQGDRPMAMFGVFRQVDLSGMGSKI